MQYDETAAEKKRDELSQAARASATTGSLPEPTLDRILAAFARITPPQEPEITVGLVIISSPYSEPKAESRKVGNVLLNWRRLIDIVPDISLAGLGAATLPVSPAIAAVLAGLYVWNKLWRGSVEELSNTEAVTMLALWQNCDSHKNISEQDGLSRTNELLASYSMPPLSQRQYAAAIDKLLKIECIAINEGVIRLIEWVRVKYT